MTTILTARYRIHVAYQCRTCTWGSMVALGFQLTESEIRRWFACPAHPTQTEINILDRDLIASARKGR